jgi:hypothetical protein
LPYAEPIDFEIVPGFVAIPLETRHIVFMPISRWKKIHEK